MKPIRAGTLLEGTHCFWNAPSALFITHGAVFRGHPVAWGEDHHKTMRRRFPHVIRVTVMGEDLPEEHNRVEIDPNLKDTSGIPAPRVVYSYSENSLRMLEHGGTMARQALRAAGVADILDSGPVTPAYHLMGTARTGTDPRKSVVNASHKAHDVPNLYVVDGSSFTTSAAVNPTSTDRSACAAGG